MSAPATPRAPRSPSARHRRAAAAALATVVALLLAGCGLRWETDAPAEPVPDAAEALRRVAVDDALDLAAAARSAGPGAPEAVAAVLTAVDETATTQVDALGGVYDSGLPDPAGSPAPSASPSATAAGATPAEVLDLLGATASGARSAALGAEDAGLARLLASVATSRAQLAHRLAGALGVDVPAVDADAASTWTQGGAADGSGSGDGSAAVPSPSGSASAAPSPTASAVPEAAGSDLGRSTLEELALAEDQAGFAFEVAAARLSDADRDRARTAAAQHRATATAWATAAGIAGTAEDPRRVSYASPGDLSSADTVRAACASLLEDLAAVHADAVLATSAGSADRTAVVDGLRTAAVDALAWGAVPSALPGLPSTTEQPADAGPDPSVTPAG